MGITSSTFVQWIPFFSYKNEWPNSIGKSQGYINLISDNSLKQLVETNHRPHMLQIRERITSLMTGEFILNMKILSITV